MRGGKRSFKLLLDDDDPAPGDPHAWLISPDDVGCARANWSRYCDDRSALLTTEIRNHHKRTTQSRNAHAAVEAILRLDCPRAAL